MSTESTVTISNGSVTYFDAEEVDLLHMEASPPFFEVSFMLDAESEMDGLKVRNIFHLRTRVGGLPPETPWSEVEARASEQLTLMLEGIARRQPPAPPLPPEPD